MMKTRSRLSVFVADSSLEAVEDVEVKVDGPGDLQVGRDKETGAFVVGGGTPGTTLRVVGVLPDGRTSTLDVAVGGGEQQVVLSVPREDELTYRRGDSVHTFRPDDDHHLLFVNGKGAGKAADAVLKELGLESEPLGAPGGDPARRDEDHDERGDESAHVVTADPDQIAEATQALRRRKLEVRVAKPIRHRKEQPPHGLTDEVVAAFEGDVTPEQAARIAAEHGLRVEREVRHAGNAWLLTFKGGASYDVLEAAAHLAADDRVLWAEPNLILVLQNDQYTPNDTLFGQQEHLVVINADDAWDRLDDVATALRGGSPAICVGVVDFNGIAPNHSELTANLTDGTSKLLASVNFAPSPIVAQTAAALAGDHGTQCAGSAVGMFDNNRGIAGVAPNCRLIGARPRSAVDEVRLADLYLWMAGFANGSTDPGFPALPTQPADVISSSYGVTGAALSATMRGLFDHLTTFGRNGRGVVVCWSLGNSGYGDFTVPTGGRFRAWPTYEKCIAVGSSIDAAPTNPTTSIHPDPAGNTANIATQVDRRALFSPFGPTALRKPDLVSPSHTSYATTPGNPLVDPIMSAVRVGTGAVDGCPGATVCNDYANTFGGTSHSTPTVAGAVALMLAARPDLSWVSVRDVLRRTCARIDAANANAIGQWQDLDGDGAIDYSRWYGAGRLDVDAAVAAVLDPTLALADVYVRENLSDVGDVPSPGWHAHSPDIWVRPTDDPIPALAWTDPAPHANPIRSQDNFVYCRLRNRGTAPASTVYVRASITHFPGFEFRYPQEFEPTTNVGAPLPTPITALGTYLIGEVRVDDLQPGADTIVKMTWPAALIPPAQVVVGTATVNWHPCLLLEVSPHDGPAPATGVIAVRADNNLAQRNIHIDESGGDSWVGMVVGTFDKVGVRSLVVDTRHLKGDLKVLLHFADEEATSLLRRGAKSAFVPELEGEREPVGGSDPGRLTHETEGLSIHLPDRTRLLLRGGLREPMLEVIAAAGSRLGVPRFPARATTAETRKAAVDIDEVDGMPVAVLGGEPGVVEIPLPLRGGQLVPLAVGVRGDWEGELRLTQRRGDTTLSAGYTVAR